MPLYFRRVFWHFVQLRKQLFISSLCFTPIVLPWCHKGQDLGVLYTSDHCFFTNDNPDPTSFFSSLRYKLMRLPIIELPQILEITQSRMSPHFFQPSPLSSRKGSSPITSPSWLLFLRHSPIISLVYNFPSCSKLIHLILFDLKCVSGDF